MVFEFDVIWPIPTTEDYKKKYKNKYKYKRRQWMVKRRHRRELYATFEMALNRYEQVSAYFLSRPRFSEGKLAFQPKLAGKGVHVENDLRSENFVESTRRFLRGRCPSIDIKVRYLPLWSYIESPLSTRLLVSSFSSLFLFFFLLFFLFFSNVDNVRRVDSYDVAYRTETPCEVAYPCPVSLLKLLLSHLYHSNDLG